MKPMNTPKPHWTKGNIPVTPTYHPKEAPTDKSAARPWLIEGEYITDNEGHELFRVMGSAPYNKAWMVKVVRTVNEYEALCAVADLLYKYHDIMPTPESKKALAALAAIRKQ